MQNNTPFVTPPHLPPPSASIELHRRWRALKVFLAISAIGVAAGFSGAAMLLGWVWPSIELGQIGSTAIRTTAGRPLLDDTTRRSIAPMLMRVYNGVSTLAGTTVFKNEQAVAPALVVGSDGWVVLYHPGPATAVKNWQALGGSTNRFRVLSAIADQTAGILFVHVEPQSGFTEPLKPAIFQNEVNAGDQVYAWSGSSWQSATVMSIRPEQNGNAHEDTAPVLRYAVNTALTPGSIVVSADGNAVGVVTQSGSVLPASHIARVWAAAHEAGEATYPTLGLEGWYAEEMPFFIGSNAAQGFLVNRSVTASSTLQRGDIITEVNGATLTADILWDYLQNQTVRLTVWRSGSSSEVVVPVKRAP